jgi:hypothetical protein
LKVVDEAQRKPESQEEEAPHAGRQLIEGCFQSRELCLPSLISLSPSPGLASTSMESCKLLISKKGTPERQSESLKRK